VLPTYMLILIDYFVLHFFTFGFFGYTNICRYRSRFCFFFSLFFYRILHGELTKIGEPNRGGGEYIRTWLGMDGNVFLGFMGEGLWEGGGGSSRFFIGWVGLGWVDGVDGMAL